MEEVRLRRESDIKKRLDLSHSAQIYDENDGKDDCDNNSDENDDDDDQEGENWREVEVHVGEIPLHERAFTQGGTF